MAKPIHLPFRLWTRVGQRMRKFNRQCALMEGHIAVTCQIKLNHPSTAAMRLMANYFDHLLSLDTPTYTVTQIAKHFESNTVLLAFHAIQPSSFSYNRKLLYVYRTCQLKDAFLQEFPDGTV